jgi:predicted MFS family arabinose efflux permease
VANVGPVPIWTPLRIGVFRAVWLAVLASNIGLWMQMVGAQWLLVRGPNAALLVSLVQVADNLPDAAFGLVGGVLADIFDRRKLQIVIQLFMTATAVAMTGMTFFGPIPPAVLLTLTFLLGMGSVITLPAYQSLVPEMVPRAQIPPATTLSALAVNISRAVGPAIAGLLIARTGVAAVFAVNAAANLMYAVVMLAWRPRQGRTQALAEPFVSALRAGGRYVRYAPVVRRLLLRAALFVVPASVLLALLPLVASQRLHLGADAYGALLGAFGVGAIVGAVVLSRLQARWSVNQVTFMMGVVFAAAVAGLVLVPSLPLALLVLLPAGMGWIIVLSDVNASLQLFLPGWVRARGLSIFQMVFFGGQAAGAVLWGLLAQQVGLVTTFLIAAAALLVGSATLRIWPLPDTSGMDRSLVRPWSEPQLVIDPATAPGPVVVTTTYTVTPDRQAPFLQAMEHLRTARLRTGATDWGLFRDGATPHRFVELFTVDSWEEHLRQHNDRLTGTDWAFEQQANALSDPPPQTSHLLGVEVQEERLA